MLVQTIMIYSLGFLTAFLIFLISLPVIWRRAGERKRRQIFKTLPLSEAEIKAAQDQLRAAHAVKIRRMESQVEQVKTNATAQLVELNRREMEISHLKNQGQQVQNILNEKDNHISVLQQKIDFEVPKLKDKAERLVWLLTERERELDQYRLHGGSLVDDEPELDQDALIARQKEIETIRAQLVEGTEGSGRTIIEQSETLLEENLELNRQLTKLLARAEKLERQQTHENSALRNELHKITDAILSGQGASKPRPDNIHAIQVKYGHFGDLHEKHENQLSLDLQRGIQSRPRFLEREHAARGNKPRYKNPGQKPGIQRPAAQGAPTQGAPVQGATVQGPQSTGLGARLARRPKIHRQEPAPQQMPHNNQQQPYPNDPASIIEQAPKPAPASDDNQNLLTDRIAALRENSS